MQPAAIEADLSVTGAYPRLLMQLLRERGQDVAPMLDAVGLSLEQLDGVDTRISLLQYAGLAQAAMTACNDEGLGCALALRTPPTAHGPLGFAMMSSETLGDALTLGLQYMPLLQDKAPLAYQTDDTHARIRPQFAAPFMPISLRRFFTEALMVGIARSAAWLAGQDRIEGELWLDYPEPPYHARYAAQLPKVRHSMTCTQLCVPIPLLRQRLPLADKIALTRALAQCERELALVTTSGSHLIARVRELLQASPGQYPSAEAAAQRLHMSVRTFKRKLAHHDTTFRALLEDAQKFDAIALLRRPHLSLERISAEMGYTDPANFTRAFKRWTGVTPSAYREKNLDAHGASG